VSTLLIFLDFLSNKFLAGTTVPSENDIRIAEKYFEDCIARLCNELAVIAFMTACRLDGPGVFESLAQIMKFQMVVIFFHKNTFFEL
jgi:hypothetical protein